MATITDFQNAPECRPRQNTDFMAHHRHFVKSGLTVKHDDIAFLQMSFHLLKAVVSFQGNHLKVSTLRNLTVFHIAISLTLYPTCK